METMTFLQNYWWFLISVLGALLVFMLFVQGGQSMILSARNATDRSLMVNVLGRKWELTFTTLVVFGGAFFVPAVLLHKFRRSLLAVDADSDQLHSSGCEL